MRTLPFRLVSTPLILVSLGLFSACDRPTSSPGEAQGNPEPGLAPEGASERLSDSDEAIVQAICAALGRARAEAELPEMGCEFQVREMRRILSDSQWAAVSVCGPNFTTADGDFACFDAAAAATEARYAREFGQEPCEDERFQGQMRYLLGGDCEQAMANVALNLAGSVDDLSGLNAAVASFRACVEAAENPREVELCEFHTELELSPPAPILDEAPPVEAIEAVENDREPAELGAEVFQQYGCHACHGEEAGNGPPLAGILGQERALADGTTVVADEAYLRRGILEPNAEVLAGYPPIHPSFAGRLSDVEVAALIAFLW